MLKHSDDKDEAPARATHISLKGHYYQIKGSRYRMFVASIGCWGNWYDVSCINTVNLIGLKEGNLKMCKFKVGDYVKVLSHGGGNYTVGQTGTIIYISSPNPEGERLVELDNGDGYRQFESRFKLIHRAYPNPPHKHAEVIKAWADGADIEVSPCGVRWVGLVSSAPTWNNAYEYRVKPQPSPQEIEKQSIIEEMAKLQERLDNLEV